MLPPYTEEELRAEINRQRTLKKEDEFRQQIVREVLEEVIDQPSSDKSNVFVREPVLEYKEFPLYKLPVMSNYTFPQEMIELTGVKVLCVSSPSGQSNELCVDSIPHLPEINETRSERKVPNDLIAKINQVKNICESEFLIACKNHAKYSAYDACKDQPSRSRSIEHASCLADSYESFKSNCSDICGKILAVFSDSEI